VPAPEQDQRRRDPGRRDARLRRGSISAERRGDLFPDGRRGATRVVPLLTAAAPGIAEALDDVRDTAGTERAQSANTRPSGSCSPVGIRKCRPRRECRSEAASAPSGRSDSRRQLDRLARRRSDPEAGSPSGGTAALRKSTRLAAAIGQRRIPAQLRERIPSMIALVLPEFALVRPKTLALQTEQNAASVVDVIGRRAGALLVARSATLVRRRQSPAFALPRTWRRISRRRLSDIRSRRPVTMGVMRASRRP
jgi:hypothetical protein